MCSIIIAQHSTKSNKKTTDRKQPHSGTQGIVTQSATRFFQSCCLPLHPLSSPAIKATQPKAATYNSKTYVYSHSEISYRQSAPSGEHTPTYLHAKRFEEQTAGGGVVSASAEPYRVYCMKSAFRRGSIVAMCVARHSPLLASPRTRLVGRKDDERVTQLTYLRNKAAPCIR